MAIVINATTNAQLYRDATLIATAAKAFEQQVREYVERCSLIGIPFDPANGGTEPVEGFDDAENLTMEDVAAAYNLASDAKTFFGLAQMQRIAQILRNQDAG